MKIVLLNTVAIIIGLSSISSLSATPESRPGGCPEGTPCTKGPTKGDKAFIKDSVITTKIKAELFEERMSSLLHIRVDTDKKGVVVLSGTAESQSAADKAVSIARKVKGVTSVQNNIQIKADK